MFSTGKDSIVSLDLSIRSGLKVIPVFLYFVKDLSFKNNIIKFYEKKYKIKIHQHPRLEDLSRQFAAGAYRDKKLKIRKIKQHEVDEWLRNKYNTQWVVYGYKKADSLQRRGILNQNCMIDGIDIRNRKIYPLANAKEKEVFKYCKIHKLPLPVEYQYNFRDINNFKGEALLWLYNNYPNDYQKVKKQYPFIEAALIQAQMGISNI